MGMRAYLSLAIGVSLCFAVADSLPMGVTIDSATSSPSLLYLISGQNVMYISRTSKKEMIVSPIFEPEKLTRMTEIRAAYSDPDISRGIYYYFGPDYGLKVETTWKKRVKTIKYETDKRAPRAAARKGDVVYLFRKDKVAFAVNFTTWDAAEDVSKYTGMPKNIDAAWNDGDGMYLLKGNRMWRWNKDGTVSDPTYFHDEYDVTSWRLIP